MSAGQSGNIDNQDSNGFSSTSFIPQFVHRQSIKKPVIGPTVTLQQKLKKYNYQLFNVLQLITPSRLRPFQLRKPLTNYQFQKIQRKYQSEILQKFGKAEQQVLKQQQNLILMFTSIMKQFKTSKDKYFYILTKKTKRVYHFYHYTDKNKDKDKQNYSDTILTICNLGQKMSSELDKSNIPYQRIPFQQQCQKIQIKNQAIHIFWGILINKIIQNQKHFKSFYILTNFIFPGGMQVLPVELFNGLQKQKQYNYIAKPITNIIGQQLIQVYRMKISGLWTYQNIQKLCQVMRQQFGDKYFDIELQIDKVTQYLNCNNQQQRKIQKSK